MGQCLTWTAAEADRSAPPHIPRHPGRSAAEIREPLASRAARLKRGKEACIGPAIAAPNETKSSLSANECPRLALRLTGVTQCLLATQGPAAAAFTRLKQTRPLRRLPGTSRVGITVISCPGSPRRRATRASAADLPMAVAGTTVVVRRRGRTEAASMPPQPAMPRSSGTRMPRASQ